MEFKVMTYAYLLTPEEVLLVNKADFTDLYSPDHSLGKKYSTENYPVYLGLTQERNKHIPGCIGKWHEFDNPIIHEPSLTAKYLTHYILATKNDAIAGTVVFDRSVGGGEYIAIMNDGTERFRTCGQTSLLTHEEIEQREEDMKDKSADIYLWPLQMMYV